VALLRLRSDLALALTCFGLYVAAAAQVRRPGGSALFVAVSAVSAPVVQAANRVGSAWEDVRLGQRSLATTLDELKALRARVNELQRTNQVLTAEVAALRQSERLLQSFPSYGEHAVVARVVARDLLGSHTIRIDRGLRDGVARDSPVLAGRGVLGRIDKVAEGWSRVQLLSHPQAAAAARILGFDQEVLLSGGDHPTVGGLVATTQVPDGTPVVTTGSEGIYPPGLLLGSTKGTTVKSVLSPIPVTLAANPTDALVVLVLQPLDRGRS
jgi:rod shape-determining protein MreC